MPRQEKVDAVQEITHRLNDSDAVLLAEYRGLKVGEIADVRNSLRDAGADLKVFKNTLTRIAAREVGMGALVAMLEGPTAVTFCRGDAATAAKALDEATRKYPVLSIKGGVLGGRVIDAAQATELAHLESREVLLTKVATMLNAPAQQTVNVASGLLRNLGSVLAQVVAQKEGSGGEVSAA
jgi:large subunit ribosomal protein L10